VSLGPEVLWERVERNEGFFAVLTFNNFDLIRSIVVRRLLITDEVDLVQINYPAGCLARLLLLLGLQLRPLGLRIARFVRVHNNFIKACFSNNHTHSTTDSVSFMGHPFISKVLTLINRYDYEKLALVPEVQAGVQSGQPAQTAHQLRPLLVPGLPPRRNK